MQTIWVVCVSTNLRLSVTRGFAHRDRPWMVVGQTAAAAAALPRLQAASLSAEAKTLLTRPRGRRCVRVSEKRFVRCNDEASAGGAFYGGEGVSFFD
jgi:hypothetical protein